MAMNEPTQIEQVDHPYLPDNTGHNCLICELRDDSLHLCWPEAHSTPDREHQWFLRRVVEAIDRYQDDGKGLTLTAEDKVKRAMRMTYSFEYAGPFTLTEEGAVFVAATIVAAEDDMEGSL